MKALPSSTFWDTIPRVSQSLYEWYLSFRRKRQVYRLRGSEVSEGRECVRRRGGGGSRGRARNVWQGVGGMESPWGERQVRRGRFPGEREGSGWIAVSRVVFMGGVC